MTKKVENELNELEKLQREHELKIQEMTAAHELKMLEIDQEMAKENRLSDLNRARSFSIGTCFGGITEVGIRGNDGKYLWAALQPTEVIETINQLAANVGCEIKMLPKEDFSAWRGWQVSEKDKLHFGPYAPQPLSLTGDPTVIGRSLAPPEKQGGMPLSLKKLDDLELLDALELEDQKKLLEKISEKVASQEDSKPKSKTKKT